MVSQYRDNGFHDCRPCKLTGASNRHARHIQPDVIRRCPVLFFENEKSTRVCQDYKTKGRVKTTLVRGAEVHCYAQIRTTLEESDATTGPAASKPFEV